MTSGRTKLIGGSIAALAVLAALIFAFGNSIVTPIERVPGSVIEASSDLGAPPGATFRRVILPLAFPGVVAGSIFTFSLTLGDFIIPTLVGPSGLFIGNYVYVQQGAVGNIPMAAAFTLVPIVLIGIYLALARRMGAFDAL